MVLAPLDVLKFISLAVRDMVSGCFSLNLLYDRFKIRLIDWLIDFKQQSVLGLRDCILLIIYAQLYVFGEHIYSIIIMFDIVKSKKVKLPKGDQTAPFSIAITPRCERGRHSFSLDCPTLPLIRTLYCWMLSKEVSSTIFWILGMTRPGIEPRSSEPLAILYSLGLWAG